MPMLERMKGNKGKKGQLSARNNVGKRTVAVNE